MKDLNKLFGSSSDIEDDKITNLILEMNATDINFDVRFVEDMEISLILDEIYKISKSLDLKNAIVEIDKIKMQTQLLTFNKKRHELFNSEDTELRIMATGLGQVVSLSDMAKEVFGWDKIGKSERYIKRKPKN